jgi:hypothetical protein
MKFLDLLRKKKVDTFTYWDEFGNQLNENEIIFRDTFDDEDEDDNDGGYEEDVGVDFVWGIISKNDTSGKEPSFLTENDFDIIYHRCSNTYVPSLCLTYDFANENEEKEYIKEIFGGLTNWMVSTDRDINYKIPMERLINDGINFWSEYESLEELYATFKIIVENL